MQGLHLGVRLDAAGALATVKLLQGSYGRFVSSVKASGATTAAGFSRINKGVNGLLAPLRMLPMIGGIALGALAAAAVVVGAKFEQSMANVASVAGATGEELQRLSDVARSWGKQTAFSASQGAEAMYSLASAGQTVVQIEQSVGGVLLLAGAAATNLGQAAEMTVQTLKMFGLEANQTNRVVNTFAAGISASMLTAERLHEAMSQVGTTASAMGMQLEETVATLGLLHNAGMIASTAGTRLKNVLSRLASPNSKLEELLGKTAFTGENLGEVMDALADSSATAGDIFKAFGRIAAPAALAMMKMGSEEMANMTNKVTGTTKAMEMYKVQMATVNSQFKIMKSAAEETFIATFMAVRDSLDGLIQALISGINKSRPYIVGAAQWLVEWVAAHKDIIKTSGKVAAALLAVFVGFKLIGIAVAIIKPTIDIVMGSLLVMKGVFLGLKAVWVAGWALMHIIASGPWGILLGIAIAALVGIIVGFVKYREETTAIISSVGNWFKKVWSDISTFAGKVGESIWKAVEGPINWVKDKIFWLGKQMGKAMELIVPGWREMWKEFIVETEEKGNRAQESIAVGFGDAFEFVKGAATQFKDKFVAGLRIVEAKVKDGIETIRMMGAAASEGIVVNVDVNAEPTDKEKAVKAAVEAYIKEEDALRASLIKRAGMEDRYNGEWLDAKLQVIADEFESSHQNPLPKSLRQKLKETTKYPRQRLLIRMQCSSIGCRPTMHSWRDFIFSRMPTTYFLTPSWIWR